MEDMVVNIHERLAVEGQNLGKSVMATWKTVTWKATPRRTVM
jgi:hypothetical protein